MKLNQNKTPRVPRVTKVEKKQSISKYAKTNLVLPKSRVTFKIMITNFWGFKTKVKGQVRLNLG